VTGADAAGEAVQAAAALKVVRGAPDEAELAALVAGMAAYAAASAAEEPGSPTSAWMDRSRTMRGSRTGVLGRGDAAWRHSLR
jgi:hypothetical protein